MRVGVVGCGQIGRRRAEVAAMFGDETVAVADTDGARSAALSRDLGCEAVPEWRRLTSRKDIDAVVVSTTHDALAAVSIDALQHGKHLLVEKPMGRNVSEAEAVIAAAADCVVKVGYNHRYHPAVSRAHQLARDGVIGRLLYIRSRYGHGGRPGYDREWRADRSRSGGGELLDQGVHLVDLGRWFLGDFSSASGVVDTCVWRGAEDEGDPDGSGSNLVEDNAFALLRTCGGQTLSLHASWTQWKNLFSFEVFGEEGYLLVEGLGGNYGPERLAIGRRNMQGGPPEEHVEAFEGLDRSWELEWQAFTRAIDEGSQPPANGRDGLAALRAVKGIYASAASGAVVAIEGD